MRTFFVAIVLFFTLIFSLPYHIHLRRLWKKDPDKSWRKARNYVSAFFRRELKIAGCKLEIKGYENIPTDTPALFVGNHRSYFDILVSHEAINRPVGFIAKKEIKKVPLLHYYMDDIGCLMLDRDDIKQGLKTINQGAQYLKMGHCMVLFPEGTRNQSNELLPFKEGGYKMAEKSGCPIIPMAITGTDLMLEASPKKRVTKGKVIVEFGEPFNPKELAPKERKEKYAELPNMIQAMRDTHNINI